MSETQYCIDLKKLCDIKGAVYAYFFDVNHILIACNQLKLDFYRDFYGKENIIGQNPCGFAGSNDSYNENMLVITQKIPRQSYQTWIIKDRYRLDLITFKMPIFDTQGEVLGVLTISHLINKFCANKALELGFSKREVECLFYLLEGNTAKEIAMVLKLSYRTVEGYIDSMKNKAGCSTTSELILKAAQNDITHSINNNVNNKLNPLSENLNDATKFSIKTMGLDAYVFNTGEHDTLIK